MAVQSNALATGSRTITIKGGVGVIARRKQPDLCDLDRVVVRLPQPRTAELTAGPLPGTIAPDAT